MESCGSGLPPSVSRSVVIGRQSLLPGNNLTHPRHKTGAHSARCGQSYVRAIFVTMETAFNIGWLLWALIAAWTSRALIVCLFSKRGAGAYGLAYGFWVLSFLGALGFVSWTGMQMYGFDRDNPWQVAGWYVLFISPFGLPLLAGAPIVLLIDAIRFGWTARGRQRG